MGLGLGLEWGLGARVKGREFGSGRRVRAGVGGVWPVAEEEEAGPNPNPNPNRNPNPNPNPNPNL